MASDKMDRGLDEIIADKVGTCTHLDTASLASRSRKTMANSSISAAMDLDPDAAATAVVTVKNVKITPVTG